MMFAIVLFGLLGLAAVLASVSMTATWGEYRSAWNALDAQRAAREPARQRYLTIRVVGSQGGMVAAPAYAVAPEFRTRSVTPARRAAV